MNELIRKNISRVRRFAASRSVWIAVVFVCAFNFLSTNILPRDLFLVRAASIDAGELVNYANAERQARGLGTLSIDSRLVSAAYAKGQDMLEKDYWSHYGPNGESPWMFISQSGYEYVYAGENLAKDFSSSAPIHSAWMASPTHRDNILNSNYKNIGIAIVTGEFQGQETTLVVQMFGSLSGEVSEQTVLPADNQQLPYTGNENETEQEPLKPPVITDPVSGDILNEAAFTIRGISEESSKVRIYDNEEKKGDAEVVDQTFAYDSGDYQDGSHILYAKAVERDKVKSDASDKVSIIVDTIVPNIKKETASIDHFEIDESGRVYFLNIEIEDNPVEVVGEFFGDKLVFSFDDEKWRTAIPIDGETESLKITATDKAGNSTESEISKEEMQNLIDAYQGETSVNYENKKWIFSDIGERIFTRTLRGKVNFIITLVMLCILLFEQILLAKTGLTKTSANNYLHIPVFVLLLFVSLLGGGGEIL